MDIEISKPEEVIIKKEPGRPSHKKPSDLEQRGIINQPDYIDYQYPMNTSYMELLYNNPIMFKNIFKAFDNYNTNTIICHFDHDGVYLTAYSHTKKNFLYTKIYGKHMHAYYCKEPFDISLDVNKIFTIMKTIDNVHGYIKLRCTEENYQQSISISLMDESTGELSVDTILNYIVEETYWDFYTFLDSNSQEYMVKYSLDYDRFKKSINKSNSLVSEIKYNKMAGVPLEITYRSADNRLSHESSFTNAKFINLNSKLEDGEICSATVNTNNLKGLAKAIISNSVDIYIYNSHPLLIQCKLDQDVVKVGGKKTYQNGTEKALFKMYTIIEGMSYIDDDFKN